jgi:hypothetical protein
LNRTITLRGREGIIQNSTLISNHFVICNRATQHCRIVERTATFNDSRVLSIACDINTVAVPTNEVSPGWKPFVARSVKGLEGTVDQDLFVGCVVQRDDESTSVRFDGAVTR